MDITLVLLIAGPAVVLFVTEKSSVDLVALPAPGNSRWTKACAELGGQTPP